MKLNKEKSRLVHTDDEGFDYLGFNVRAYRTKTGRKLLIKPTQKAILDHLHKLKLVIRSMRALPQGNLIDRFNPIIRGWSYYYRHVVSKKAFATIDHLLFKKLYRWALRRHPKKGKCWVVKKYWRSGWVFTDGEQTLCRHDKVKIVRHVMVKTTKSPYDGDTPYWAKRNAGNRTRLAGCLNKTQKGRCPVCRRSMLPNEKLDIHHRNGNHSNNRYENLWLTHRHCHDTLHSGK